MSHQKLQRRSALWGAGIVAILLAVILSGSTGLGAATSSTLTFAYHVGDAIVYDAIQNGTNGTGYSGGDGYTYVPGVLTPSDNELWMNLTAIDTSVANNANFSYDMFVNTTAGPTSTPPSSDWNSIGTGSNLFNGSTLVPNIIAVGGFNVIPNDTNPADWITTTAVNATIPIFLNSYSTILNDIANAGNAITPGSMTINTPNDNGPELNYTGDPVMNLTAPIITITPSHDNGTITIAINIFQNGLVNLSSPGPFYLPDVNVTDYETDTIVANYSNSRLLNYLSINLVKNESLCATMLGPGLGYGSQAFEYYENATAIIVAVNDTTGGAFEPFQTYLTPTVTTTTTTGSGTTPTAFWAWTSWPIWTVIGGSAAVIAFFAWLGYVYMAPSVQAKCRALPLNARPFYCKK
jgi:hypothetical protein